MYNFNLKTIYFRYLGLSNPSPLFALFFTVLIITAIPNSASAIDMEESAGVHTDASQWTLTATHATASNNTYYITHSNTDSSFSWNPTTAQVPDGEYNIYVSWPNLTGGDAVTEHTAVPYTITHSGGTSIVTLDQNGGATVAITDSGVNYYHLGTFTLDSTNRTVSLDHTVNGNIYTIIDAIRFVPVVPIAPPPIVPIVPGCSNISIPNVPLDTKVQGANANLMFIIDDNATMDQEVMTDEADTKFDIPGSGGARASYIYSDMHKTGTEDSVNARNDTNGKRLGGTVAHPDTVNLALWKAQWYGHNYMFYKPSTDYEPWVSTATKTFSNADKDNPVCDPLAATPSACTMSLNGTFHTIGGIVIKNAHYFMLDDTNADGIPDPGEQIFLINLSGSAGAYTVEYYLVTGLDADNRVTSLLAKTTADVPDALEITRTVEEERQNFANWFSYLRRRSKMVASVTATTINSLKGVNAGIYSVNGHVNQPVKPINAGGVNQAEIVLNSLYTNYAVDTSSTANPTTRALMTVGYYFSPDIAATSPLDHVGTGASEAPSPIGTTGGTCQQNFAVVISDNNYQGVTNTVGNVDGAAEYVGTKYYDTDNNTLADIAMLWYQNDIATTIDNNVPTSDADPANYQHMVTFGVGFGAKGTQDPATTDINAPGFSWSAVHTNDPRTTMENLWHATVNSRGEFIMAQTPDALSAAMINTINNIYARLGSGAGISVNGDELYATINSDIMMYQTNYHTKDWRGNVLAYNLAYNAGTLNVSTAWDAESLLSARLGTSISGQHTTRKIITYSGTGTAGSAVSTPFQYANITAAQKALLSANATTAEKMVNYLRGAKNDEEQNGGTFRDRAKTLGDFVGSKATYKDGYLYVGSNDGMLHVFNAATGAEMFTYVPNLIFDKLVELTKPSYSHFFYLNGTPSVSAMGAKTYVVGGLAEGGKGLYCLDATTPTNYASETETELAARIQWEYPRAGITDNDLGYTYGRAYIIKTNATNINSADSNFSGYVIVFGNGYNSVNGNAVLYFMDPITGTVLKKIDTGVSCANGLSSPSPIDINIDQKVDYIYAGDLLGNMWKFDLTDDDFNNWEIAFKSGATPMPLFKAKSTGGVHQPITSEPDIMRACGTDNGYLVIFGTGRYLEDNDIYTTNRQTVYGVWDYGDDADDSEYLGTFDPSSVTNLSNQPALVTLQEQVSLYDNYVTVGADSIWIRVLSQNTLAKTTVADSTTGQKENPLAGDAGWFFDLPITKERMANDIIIRDGKAIFTTFVPEAGACSSGGYSIVHEVDACTGGRLSTAIFDISGDGSINDPDDYVEIPDYPSIPPSARRYEGKLYGPAILTVPGGGGGGGGGAPPAGSGPDIEMKLFSTSGGGLQKQDEVAEGRGMYYWKKEE